MPSSENRGFWSDINENMEIQMKKQMLLLVVFTCWSTCNLAANLFPGDSSFETGNGVWQKKGEIDNIGFDGEKSLKINKTLMSKKVFSFIPGRKYFFSVYLKAEKDGTPVKLTAYRTNWMGNNIIKQVKAGKKWKRFVMKIPPQTIDTHNKIWFIIDPHSKLLWVDACQLEEEAVSPYKSALPAVMSCEILSPVRGNIFHPGEKVRIKLACCNNLKKEAEFSLLCDVTDYFGNKVYSFNRKQTIKSKKNFTNTCNLPEILKKGFFHVNYRLASGDRCILSDEASFCIVDHPLPFSLEEGSLFGICGGPEKRIPACARIGVKWFAVTIRWAYETEPGKLNENIMKNISAKIDSLVGHGINPACLLRRTPTWAAIKKHPHDIYPPVKKHIKNYGEFVFKIVSKFKNKVKLWELWGGEVDLLKNKITSSLNKNEDWFIDILAEMYKAGYKGAKRADPDCIVATASVSGVDCSGGKFNFDEKVLAKAKGHYDEVAIHPYCYPWYFDGKKRVESPEEHNLTQIYRRAHQMSGANVWNGEFGFAISPAEKLDSQNSREMADYMVRSYLLTAAVPQVKRLLWYTIAGDYDSFSIWKWPNPRPLVAAYAALAQVLTGCDNPLKINLGSNIMGYSFTKGNGSIAALWVPSGEKIIIGNFAKKGIKVIDVMGNEIKPDGGVVLSGSPIYALSDKESNQLRKLIQASEIHLAPLKATLRVQSLSKLTLLLSNQLNKEMNGEIKLKIPIKNKGIQTFKKTFRRILPGASDSLTLELPDSIELINNSCTLKGVITTNAGNVPLEQKFEFLPCKRMDNKIKIDGNLNEWRDFPFIKLKTMASLFPPDAASHDLWQGEGDLSVKASCAWDDSNFYFVAEVADDILSNNFKPLKIYSGDCIQFAFDCLNKSISPGLKDSDKEYTIAYNSKDKRGILIRDWPGPLMELKATMVVKRKGKHIVYELALPFKELSPLKPEAGNVFGFNFTALDNDAKRVEYWMGLTYGICGGKDTSIFKKFIFKNNGSQK